MDRYDFTRHDISIVQSSEQPDSLDGLLDEKLQAASQQPGVELNQDRH
jgi:hypothetical protein